MRPKSLVLLVLALGCGLVAAIGINQVMSNRGDANTTVATTPIFVALEQIGIGDPIRAEELKLADWPSASLPEGAITDLAGIEGRRARTMIYPNDAVVESKLLGKGETGGGVIETIPAGMRIVPVKVDSQSGLAGLVKPGDRVDLSVTLRADPSAGITLPVTQTFLQNVKVAAVDADWQRDGDGEAVVAKVISLIVTPQQVQMVTIATEMGTIRLSLRSPTDSEVVDSTPVSPSDIFGGSITTPNAPKKSNIDDLLSQLGAAPAPVAPVQAAPVIEMPKKNITKMVIWDGENPREVLFEDGKPVEFSGAPTSTSTSGTPAMPISLPATPGT